MGKENIFENEIKKFWTDYPMINSGLCDDYKRVPIAKIFDHMDKRLRSNIWYAQDQNEPIFSNFFDYRRYCGKKILEIGYGTGWLLEEFIKVGAEVYGIDLSEAHLDICKSRFRNRNVNLRLSIASWEQIPYPDNSFDLVVSHGVLHHTENDENCVSEMQRVMKPGSKAFLMVYRKWSIKYCYQKMFKQGILRLGLFKHKFNLERFMAMSEFVNK